jgi:hypothetical protein
MKHSVAHTKYTSFTEAFQRWHYRMNVAGFERLNACESLTLLQTVNVFFVLVRFTHYIPGVVMWGTLAASAFGFYLLNRKTFAAHQIPTAYAKDFRSHVPKYREFPSVYNYLIFSLALFAAPFVSVVLIAP